MILEIRMRVAPAGPFLFFPTLAEAMARGGRRCGFTTGLVWLCRYAMWRV